MTTSNITQQHFFINHPTPDSLCFILKDQSLLLYSDAGKFKVPSFKDLITLNLIDSNADNFYCFAKANGLSCLVLTADHRIKNHSSLQSHAVKASFQLLDEQSFKLAALACHLTHWFHTHRFCGKCGHKMHNKPGERARQCAACCHVVFPRLSPSIIVLVTKGEQMLLARSPHFPDGVYSTLAGFVEPGESVEEAVAREVFEEVGLTLKNISYFGSQPWPFPESLMLGFTADYAGGELTIDNKEIEAAAWFDVHHLPKLPTKISIARQLIDQHLLEFSYQ